ncbi:MAG TPA: CoA transferase [Stellaceae bacterium]|jgi:crotonobetainyl-CoA:carnitine CoA-transferase CaiB-like acyl-CoA transferase|nr:CoA transferase [Stellaceae bacterium]
MPGPLQGYRIVDLTSNVSGPLGTMILGDQGADVIKVEAPEGDHTRAGSKRRGGFSAGFLNINRNKRSITLNLKDPKALLALKKLAATADVFVQNYRPGVADRIGVGEAAIRAVAPKIVYVSISGFGEQGPYAQKPVYDPLIQGFSGLATVQAGSDEARPRMLRTILPDKLTAITGSQAITAALLARERTGEGQHVQLSMIEAVLAFLWGSDMTGQTFVGNEPAKQEAASSIDLIYETADGYITVAVQTNKQWVGLTEALEQPQWLEDARFRTPALRQENVEARLQLTQDVLIGRPSAEWLDRLTKADVPCAPVLTRNEVIRHPHVAAMQIIAEYDHPTAGRLRQTRAAARFSGTPTAISRGAPALGEHTDEILAELGYSTGEIDAMHAGGALDANKGARA